jgi:hypothetical protein
MHALIGPLYGAIVESADRIKAGTADRSVQRGALLFKIEAVPAMRKAVFRPNPFAAAVDSWVLSLQMAEYYENGRGREALGEAASIAVTTCRYLESLIEKAAASLTRSGEVSDVRDFAVRWAAENPIRHSISGRESTLSRIMELDIQNTFSTADLMGTAMITIDDVLRRLDVYSAQLLEEARWQAELFALDMAEAYPFDTALPLAEDAVQTAAEAMKAANRLLPSVESVLAVLESTPELIRQERTAVLRALQQELTRALAFVQQERISSFTLVTEERLAVLKDLKNTVMTERTALTADMEKISKDVVDHVFLRAAQIIAAVLVLLFIGVWVLLVLARRIFDGRHESTV